MIQSMIRVSGLGFCPSSVGLGGVGLFGVAAAGFVRGLMDAQCHAEGS